MLNPVLSLLVLTLSAYGLACLGVAVYDPLAVWRGWPTVSRWFIDTSYAYPVFPVLIITPITFQFGILVGHLCFGQEVRR